MLLAACNTDGQMLSGCCGYHIVLLNNKSTNFIVSVRNRLRISISSLAPTSLREAAIVCESPLKKCSVEVVGFVR